MEQEKLESRVREIFNSQGFEVEKIGNARFEAVKDGVEKKIVVYSSSEFEGSDLENDVREDELVFVDEELSKLQETLENRVSIIAEKDRQTPDMPSYEVVGSIAVINELVDHTRAEAVEAITSQHPNVETVLLKTGQLSGEFRVGEYEKLYGEGTETVHKEFSCRFRLDPTKVYYSERFSTERNRVVSQIKEGERVLVMFAGVGPFAIMAAKNANPSEVVAVEKNPEAAEYLRQNVELNSVEDTVVPVEGDVEDVVPGLGKFDRIVMPLPGSANDFLDLAVEAISENGIIHYYRFVEDGETEVIEAEIDEAVLNKGSRWEIRSTTSSGDRGPAITRMCYDVVIKK